MGKRERVITTIITNVKKFFPNTNLPITKTQKTRLNLKRLHIKVMKIFFYRKKYFPTVPSGGCFLLMNTKKLYMWLKFTNEHKTTVYAEKFTRFAQPL